MKLTCKAEFEILPHFTTTKGLHGIASACSNSDSDGLNVAVYSLEQVLNQDSLVNPACINSGYDSLQIKSVWPNTNQESRGFIKGRAPGKLTSCERDLAINLPGCFRLRKTKIARLKNPTDLLHKNLMKPLKKEPIRFLRII